MSTPILTTKLYIPQPRTKMVLRPRLSERLNEGLHQKLTLISAPAGFGKTTLVSEWVAVSVRPVAWMSLDEGDNDLTRFLTYFVAALRSVVPHIGEGLLSVLQSPQLPPVEAILTTLLNEITTLNDDFVLVLDDCHVIESNPVDTALSFLLEHLPPQMHLVMITREDPNLPLARLRARGQLAELRVADLRFAPTEAAEFLNQVMGLNLSWDDVNALETRTEGWIAGLQLAAISLQGHQAPTSFIKSFTGSHHFILDYLVEEVLHRQPESVQTFLLHTSILNRLCGSLCDAILGNSDASGQTTLEYLEHANLFIVPLDNERRWYRYHHLFADLLRQRLHHPSASSSSDKAKIESELHIRASIWFEANGLAVEAFHHAAAAHDIERAARLIQGDSIPRHFRGAVTAILDWLASLPTAALNAKPSLWWTYAALLLVNGQTTGVEEKLQAAEAALPQTNIDDQTRNLMGQIAAARATLALTRYQPDIMIAQATRALEYLLPENLPYRATAMWALGNAHFFLRELATARGFYTEALALSQAIGNTFNTILIAIGLGQVQEAENELHLAADTFRYVLQLAGDQPLQIICEAHLGLANVLYEWNDLDAAQHHGQLSLQLARQYDTVIDRFIVSSLFLVRLKLAQNDLSGAAAILAEINPSVRQPNFAHRMPEFAAAQVLLLLQQGNVAAADQTLQMHDLPMSRVRVDLAQGDTSAALATLEILRQQAEDKNLRDERLNVMVLQAIALDAHGEQDEALALLNDALMLAQAEGFVRIFVDEGLPMAQLLSKAFARGMMRDYVGNLLAAFNIEKQPSVDKSNLAPTQSLIDPLSARELEVLRLIAQGLSNHEIGARLFLAINTVKGHNQKIFAKLQVQRRTEAIVRARELGLI